MWVYDLQINFIGEREDVETCEINVNHNTTYFLTGARNMAIIRSIQRTAKSNWELSLVSFASRNCYDRNCYEAPASKDEIIKGIDEILKKIQEDK